MGSDDRRWTFSRVGGVDQVVLKDGTDILRLKDLDQKLWAVLAMPSSQPELGECLAYLDSDKDGKVRVPDILNTVEYLSGTLKSLDLLFDESSSLALGYLKDKGLQEGFEETAKSLGIDTKSKDVELDLESMDRAVANFSSLPFNGDGVVTPASADAWKGMEESRAFIETCLGAGFSVLDASGSPGVGLKEAEAFVAAAKATLEWRAAEPQGLLPLPSEERAKALGLYQGLKPLVDDYFRRCQVLAMADSPAAASEIHRLLSSVLSRNLNPEDPELAKLPIAMPDTAQTLRMDGAFHPLHAQELRAFLGYAKTIEGFETELSLDAWRKVSAAFDSYSAWKASEPLPGKPLPAHEALAGLLTDAALQNLRSLVSADEAMAAQAKALAELRTLSLVKRDFLRVLRNFVNLDDFYLKKKGIFRSGRLYLDGREMSLCLEVLNPGAHGTMAALSSMYLVYCNLSRRDGNRKSIVAALTAGDADSIFVGRNGVFYDSEGKDWDAAITKVVVQPISIREAFFSPYKWFAKTLEEMAMKRAAKAEAASMDKMKSAAAATAQIDKGAPKPEAPLAAKKMDVGTVAAIGVALGSIGAMVTGVLGIFFGLGAWMPLGILGVLLLISGPSMILAYMKLRKRNLGPLLNAEGWAVNGKLKINVPFGATLSHLAALPPGSNRQLVDPFAEKKRPWGLYLAILLVLGALAAAFFLGWLDPLLGR